MCARLKDVIPRRVTPRTTCGRAALICSACFSQHWSCAPRKRLQERACPSQTTSATTSHAKCKCANTRALTAHTQENRCCNAAKQTQPANKSIQTHANGHTRTIRHALGRGADSTKLPKAECVRARVTPARSPWQVHVACIPRLR